MKTTFHQFTMWLNRLSMEHTDVEIEGMTNSIIGPFTAKRVVCYRSNKTKRIGLVVNPMGTHLSDEFYRENDILSIFELQPSAESSHGTTCHKVPHVGTGHLHDESNDGPYDVDGVNYCGRCHQAL